MNNTVADNIKTKCAHLQNGGRGDPEAMSDALGMIGLGVEHLLRQNFVTEERCKEMGMSCQKAAKKKTGKDVLYYGISLAIVIYSVSFSFTRSRAGTPEELKADLAELSQMVHELTNLQ